MDSKKEINNILVCGIGGVGGYFGGKMAFKIAQLADKNLKIFFLARGSHLEEIKKKGLILNTPEEKAIICKPTIASNNLKEFPIPDLCIICVKSYDLAELVQDLANYLKKHTIIIPLMNGIDIYERIRKITKKFIVLPSCVYVGSHIEKPGIITQSGNPGFIFCGKDPKFPDFYPQKVIELFNLLEINFTWKDDPIPAIWEKYILVASFALVTAYTGMTLGGVISNNEVTELLKQIMNEIVLIAEKKQIKLPDNIIDDTIEFCKDYPEVKTSYQRDIEKGKQNEGDLFGGTIIRLGNKLRIQTPVTQHLYSEIQKKK